MDWIYRELSGVLLPAQTQVTKSDVKAINNLPNPPLMKITAKDVYVRRCRLAGDAVDAGFGRFRTDDMDRLLELVQGAPALIGHRKDTLGIARFFGGELERDEASGITYIVPKFYWMKDHSNAEDLRLSIDGGIYSEASLGFTFRKPICVICDSDIRRCEHIPGREYGGEVCYFHYNDVLRVTEGSFVYRGAQPGTGFALSESLMQRNDLPRFRLGGVVYRGVPEEAHAKIAKGQRCF